MAVARIIEVIGVSNDGFEEALNAGLKRANKTLRGIKGIELISQKVNIENGKIKNYVVRMKIEFVLEE